MEHIKRYAVVGTGYRATLYIDALADRFREHAAIVAFCDTCQTRMKWHARRLAETFGTPEIPLYDASRFSQMLLEQRPDVVVVTSVDATHHTYVIAALDHGCEVICEKPLTTRPDHAQAIVEAVERSGRRLRVTFNFRFAPHATAVKQLLSKGVIGPPTAVSLRWQLDTAHGADYFRRWHATKAHSGGLQLHKSSHHFDAVNWWLGDQPETVFAMGGLRFYGRASAAERGEQYAYERYTGSSDAADDPFALDLDDVQATGDLRPNGPLRGLYREAEAESGYIRDRNVFGEHVDIEDTLSLVARYRRGTLLNYALIAYAPWEGFQAIITGPRGQIELTDYHAPDAAQHLGAASAQANGDDGLTPRRELVVRPLFKPAYRVEIPPAAGAHDGADPQLVEQLFSPDPPPDPLHRMASHVDGCAGILLGMAANQSMRDGAAVRCDDLLPLHPQPVS